MEEPGDASAADGQPALGDVAHRRARREVVVEVAPDHHLHELARCRPRHVEGPNPAAVLENCHALRKIEDLAETMGDVQDRNTALTEQTHTIEERCHLVR